MKKLALALLIVGTISCNDLLMERPQAIAVETFYNTTGEVEAGIAAIYNPLKNGISHQEAVSLIEVLSDFMNGRASWENAGLYEEVLNTQNSTRAQDRWIGLYTSIRNANLIVQNVPESDGLGDKDKEKYMAEARFLRALAYFRLAQNWGAVPLRTEENFEQLEVPRSSIEEVYQLIHSDLEYAENALPDEVSVAGHPTRWSAKTVLADTYFYLGDYEKAASKSEEVINSKRFSLEEVSKPEDFENVFGVSVINSVEEIFYFKYNEEQSWAYPRYLHGVNVPYLGIDGYFVAYSNESNKRIENWDDNDLRKIYGWYKYEGFDPGTILCKKFNAPGSITPSIDYPMYRYADLLLIYAEASCRANNNPTPEGIEALNKVHRRAYGYPSTKESPIDFKISDLDAKSFLELCFQERGYETIGEGKRWLDIKRLGKEEARTLIQEVKGVNITEGKFLYPIPEREFEYNSSITEQNPGY